jgi:calcineurin-like phosphoesterase family protein
MTICFRSFFCHAIFVGTELSKLDFFMPQTWFSSDLHIGHRAIIKYCDRPFLVDDAPDDWKQRENWKEFVDVTKMNDTIIERWNETIKPSDTVWVLGDFCWPGYEHVFHQLHGNKHLIIGNHDSREVITLPWASQPQYYQELNGVFEPVPYGKRPRYVLSHYAMRSWHAMQKGSIMLYGHSHDQLPGFRLAPQDGQLSRGGGTLDVGVDCFDFRPVNLDQIKVRLATLPEFSPEGTGRTK